MARTYLTAVVAVLLCCASLAVAHGHQAGPCIECKDCQGMQSCYKVCKQTCPKQQVVVNGEACKSYGTWVAGPAEARKACEMTEKYCDNPITIVGSSPYFPVPLSQCANIAFGTCQNKAMDAHASPCGHHFKGYKQCSGHQFVDFYKGIVNDACHKAVSWIQNL